MCVIVYNKDGKPHNKDYLSVAYDNNPHGVGVMWFDNDRVCTYRDLLSKDQMLDLVDKLEGKPHALHLRWRTRGPITKNMCHPFGVSKSENRVWMMHNGTFFFLKSDKEKSDTFQFACKLGKVVKQHGSDVLFEDDFVARLEKKIETFNKVLLFRDDGEVSILNQESWHEDDGLLYSNSYSLIEGYRTAKNEVTQKKKAERQEEKGKRLSKKKRKKLRKQMLAAQTKSVDNSNVPVAHRLVLPKEMEDSISNIVVPETAVKRARVIKRTINGKLVEVRW
jgi:hypothetical protein